VYLMITSLKLHWKSPLAMNIKSPDLTRGTAYIGQWLINKHVKKGEVLPIGTILT